jgi:hypothetical protein
MIDDDGPDELAKLRLRVADLEAALIQQGELVRAIVEGRVGLVEARVTLRLCQTEEDFAPGRRLLDVIAGVIIALVAIGGLLYYLVVHPWPAWGLFIPPPHSSQLPTEEAYRE